MAARQTLMNHILAGYCLSLCLCLCLFLCYSDAASDVPQILKYENEKMDGDGYAFSFETSDGISRQETATLKHPGTPLEAIAVQGSVNWVGPDGVQYKLNYLADENGFQPQGEHLPQLEATRTA
ncbi:endocuticle structural protein SgAbd-6 isoform X1 [Drosophila subobscura]|uniref:endocuticle structural protein SgAbd-6 isoform X1 n=1 Tax=Drosophila subobscura TaxID=7241 RepID=UPI00155B22F0|nr:endocuticle structural protein SgAbd-6 isoform X1 [Drosophila subobscura]